MTSDGDLNDGSVLDVRNTAGVVIHDVVRTLAVVSAVGLLLFAASGVWPPLIAVESQSMEPHLQKGDLVFVSEPGRYSPVDDGRESNVVPVMVAREDGYRSVGDFGSVVVYTPPDSSESRVIHRASFWVSEGENWYEKADSDFVATDDCAELRNCPAPNAGFITKGDANPVYDQAAGVSPPVRPEWIHGTAHVRIPYIGWIRLLLVP